MEPLLKSAPDYLRELYEKNSEDLVMRAKLMARANLLDGVELLRRWWCQKYNKPAKDLGDYTLFELVVEFFEDYYSNNPEERYRLERELTGEIRLNTDDPLLSRWEEQIVRGIIPDLTEGMNDKDRKITRELIKKKEAELKQKSYSEIISKLSEVGLSSDEYLEEFEEKF